MVFAVYLQRAQNAYEELEGIIVRGQTNTDIHRSEYKGFHPSSPRKTRGLLCLLHGRYFEGKTMDNEKCHCSKTKKDSEVDREAKGVDNVLSVCSGTITYLSHISSRVCWLSVRFLFSFPLCILQILSVKFHILFFYHLSYNQKSQEPTHEIHPTDQRPTNMGCASSRPTASNTQSRKKQHQSRLSRPFDPNIPLHTIPQHSREPRRTKAQTFDAERYGDAFAKLNARSKQANPQKAQRLYVPQQPFESDRWGDTFDKLNARSNQQPQVPKKVYLPAQQQQQQCKSHQAKAKPNSSNTRLSRPFDPNIPLYAPTRQSAQQQPFDTARYGDAYAQLNARSKQPQTPRRDQKAQLTAHGYRVRSQAAPVQKQQQQRGCKGDTLYFF